VQLIGTVLRGRVPK